MECREVRDILARMTLYRKACWRVSPFIMGKWVASVRAPHVMRGEDLCDIHWYVPRQCSQEEVERRVRDLERQLCEKLEQGWHQLRTGRNRD